VPVSIEEAKQKAEYDMMLSLADQKKAAVRGTIQSMRDEFQRLIARNNDLPPHLALSRKVSPHYSSSSSSFNSPKHAQFTLRYYSDNGSNNQAETALTVAQIVCKL